MPIMAPCPFKILLARSIMMKHKSVHTSFLHFSLGPPKHHSRWIARIPHTKRLSKMAADAWPRRNSFEFHYRMKCTYLAAAICIHYMSKMWQKRKSRALLLLKTTVPEGYTEAGEWVDGGYLWEKRLILSSH